jgi:hypothetical protein
LEPEKSAKLTRSSFPEICKKIAAEVWPSDTRESFISAASLIKDNENIGALVLFGSAEEDNYQEIHLHFIRHPQGKAEIMALPKTPQGKKFAELICVALKKYFSGPDFSCWVNPTAY